MTNGLSDDQFQALGELIKQSVSDVFEEKQVVTKADIAHLPTKEEFYKSQAELMAEIKKVREEQPVQAQQISDVTDRVEKIESHLGLTA